MVTVFQCVIYGLFNNIYQQVKQIRCNFDAFLIVLQMNILYHRTLLNRITVEKSPRGLYIHRDNILRCILLTYPLVLTKLKMFYISFVNLYFEMKRQLPTTFPFVRRTFTALCPQSWTPSNPGNTCVPLITKKYQTFFSPINERQQVSSAVFLPPFVRWR